MEGGRIAPETHIIFGGAILNGTVSYTHLTLPTTERV